VWGKYNLWDECGQTSDRVDDGHTSRGISRICTSKPCSPYDDRETEECQGEQRNDLRKEPNLLLNGRELELGFSRHRNDETHDRAIADGEHHTAASALSYESRSECEIARLQCVS
jgi:hypothetical protein